MDRSRGPPEDEDFCGIRKDASMKSKRTIGLALAWALLAGSVSVHAADIPDAEIIAARTPETKILIVAVAPRLINYGLVDTTVVRQSSSGLHVVGVGETVYIAASPGSLQSPSYAWSIASRPGGSTAAIVDAAQVGRMFVADVEGDYAVQLVITHSTGDTTLTQQIVAAKYVGIDRCTVCHTSLPHQGFVEGYKETGHYTMLQRGLSSPSSSRLATKRIALGPSLTILRPRTTRRITCR